MSQSAIAAIPPPDETQSQSRAAVGASPVALGISLCFVIVFAVFWPVHSFEFINFDDDLYFNENPLIRGGLSIDSLKAAFLDTSTGHWHPLTWVSHLIDFELFGITPSGPHLVNAGLHAANAALLCAVLVVATGQLPLAIVAALVFGLHPMRIESVAWVSQRKDVLSMFFGLLTVLSYTIHSRHPRRISAITTPLLFLLALFAKPTMITLPVLLCAWDYWPLKRLSWRSITEKLSLFVIAALFAGIVAYAQHAGSGLRSLSEIPLDARVAGALVGITAYLGKFFLPFGIGIFYPFTTFAPGIAAGALCGLIGLSALLLQKQQHSAVRAGWIWFLVALLPTCGLIQIGGQIFADRWSYLPHIGLIVGTVWFAAERLKPTTARVLAIVSISGCIALTSYNLPFWRDSISLFSHTLEVAPNNFMAHTNLGSALDRAGKLSEAAPHYEEAVRLNPTYPEALNNLGTLRGNQGRSAEAAELFGRALAVRPGFIRARYNYGLALSNQGRDLAAAAEWLIVAQKAPEFSATVGSLRFTLTNRVGGSCSEIQSRSTSDDRARFLSVIRGMTEAEKVPAEILAGFSRVAGCIS